MDATKPCEHERQELRRRVLVNGSIQFVRQCLNCGKSENKPVAHSRVVSPVTAFDEGLMERYKAARAEFYNGQRAQEKSEFDAWYGEYLGTDKWRTKRMAVFKRCSGVCEGCGDAAATQVHHLTYEHVGDEFLFELVGVCAGCHERLHEKEPT